MYRFSLCFPYKSIFFVLALTHSTLLQAALERSSSLDASSQTINQASLENSQEYTEIFYEVSVNGYNTNQISLFVQDKSGNLFIRESDLAGYGFELPQREPLVHEGVAYYPVSLYVQGASDIDPQNLTINLSVPPDKFKKNYFQADTREFTTATQPDLGGFFNYDVYAQQYTDITAVKALFVPGVFCAAGTGTSEFLSTYNSEFQESSVVRLNTTWEIDYPHSMTSLYLGDSYTATGLWGSSVGFGGIQWGTNFGTQPAFITYPLPGYEGQAVVPSVVDLYTNNALLNKESVPPGPFAINEIPVANGSGTLNVVVTDMLGRQQTISIPYYLSTSLMKPGLHDYSIDVGFIRENFGNESNDYGQFMTVATDRVGLNDILTAEWRFEGLLDQQTVGAGAIYLLADWATVSASTAVSNSEFGGGGLLELGFQRQDQDSISFGWNVTTTSSNFTQIGYGENTVAPSFQGQFFAGIPLWEWGSLVTNYVQQNNRGVGHTGFVTVSYNRTFWNTWALTLTSLTQVSGEARDNNAVYLSLSRLFGERTTLNLGGNVQQGSDAQGTIQVNQSLPLGPGWGYNLYAGTGDPANYQASLSGQNDIGTATVGAARQADEMGYQASISGAVAVIDNDFYLSRQLGSSFGVVEVAGYEDIRVYNFNQVVATTNSKGKAFMPNLLPYQSNKIAIEPNDLPIGTEIKSAETYIIPYYQSGYLVHFAVESHYSAIARLVDVHGVALLAGTDVQSADTGHLMMVADNGDVYLNKLVKGHNAFKAVVNGKECQFSIDYIVNPDDEIPDLGTIVCHE